MDFKKEYEKEKKRNKAKLMVKALMFYADEDNYDAAELLRHTTLSLVDIDGGVLAREALEAVKDEE